MKGCFFVQINHNIANLLDEKGATQKNLADYIKVSTSTLNNWLKLGRSIPSEYIIPICEFFAVPPEKVLLNTEFNSLASDLPKDVKELISYYEKLSDTEKWKLIGRAEAISEMQSAQPAEADAPSELEKITIKCSCYKVSAGGGFALAEGDDWDEIEVEDTPESRKADFAIEVFGSSMEPLISDGDIILVKEQDDVEIGEIGVFIIDGQGYVKKKGPDRLISINEDYDDIFTDPESYSKVVGKVLAVL